MKIIKNGHSGVLQTLCRLSNQWGMFINIPSMWDYENRVPYEQFYEELYKAAPILSRDLQSVADEVMYVLGTKEEIDDAYNRIVGDDGPTQLNKYDGPVHVYALTCNNKGQLMNENT